MARPLKGRGGVRWLPLISVIALLLILVPLVGCQRILTGLGEFLVVSDPLEHADLIYVFAGDFWGSRVLFGANLGSKGWAPRVVLSGGRYQASYACDLSVDLAVQHGYPRGLFLPVRFEAHSTIEEAHMVGPIFHQLRAKRIILVTSNFHSRRAAEVFRLYLPDLDFLMEASPDDAFDPYAWWKTQPQRRLLVSEYQKMTGTFLVRFHLANADWLRQAEQ